MEYIFNVDSEIKQEYLNEKPTATAKSDSFVLRLADEYEEIMNKPIYNMSYPELKELIATQFKNSSTKAIMKNVSILKTYIDFCISKNLVLHGENRLATFSIDDAKEFVHKQALINKFIDKKKLMEYQNILCNAQDVLLLELLYIGVKGRPSKEGTLEEVINLTIDDIDEKNNMLTLTQNNGKHRIIKVEASTIELIKETYEQEYYIENNGEQTNNPRLSEPRKTKINKVENYIFRVPGRNKYELFKPNLLNSRMKRIQKYVGNPYLNYTSLYNSGMIQMAIDIYREKGEVTKEDYVSICDRYNYGGDNPERYWFNLKSLFEQYKELLRI